MYRIDHWIDGHTVSSKSGRTGNIYDPATGQVQGTVGFADVDEVDQAVANAKAALPAWRSTNLSRRAEIMFNMRELVSS